MVEGEYGVGKRRRKKYEKEGRKEKNGKRINNDEWKRKEKKSKTK